MIRILLLLTCISIYNCSIAQPVADSAFTLSQKLSQKYLDHTSQKIDQYTSRVSNKTEKTLTKLCRWETKIQSLLQKASPETAERLFGNNSLSFKKMLEEYKKGESELLSYKTSYDKYRDDLQTQLKYIDSNRALLAQKTQQALSIARSDAARLENEEARNEAIRKMIKERRQQLITQSMKYLGKNKYLQKINKESWYYSEIIKNYKQLFNEPGKAEKTAKNILNKIPAFKEFMRKNSMLTSLFSIPGEDAATAAQSIAGLQTRTSVSSMIQNRITAGGPNAMEEVRQNLQQAQAELSKLKDKVLKAGGTNSEADIPDFKPNTQKTKTFAQRLEYDANLQFSKSNSLLPGTADIGLSIGYKLNDRLLIGVGLGYKLGLGKMQRIRFTHEGIGLRSFIDWKLKKEFFVSGGLEKNHHASFKDIQALNQFKAWQQSGLIGISKKIPFKTKITKGTTVQVLYDFLHREHLPVSQPIIFRVGRTL